MDIQNFSLNSSASSPSQFSTQSVREYDLLERLNPVRHDDLLNRLAGSDPMQVEISTSRSPLTRSGNMTSESGASRTSEGQHARYLLMSDFNPSDRRPQLIASEGYNNAAQELDLYSSNLNNSPLVAFTHISPALKKQKNNFKKIEGHNCVKRTDHIEACYPCQKLDSVCVKGKCHALCYQHHKTSKTQNVQQPLIYQPNNGTQYFNSDSSTQPMRPELTKPKDIFCECRHLRCQVVRCGCFRAKKRCGSLCKCFGSCANDDLIKPVVKPVVEPVVVGSYKSSAGSVQSGNYPSADFGHHMHS